MSETKRMGPESVVINQMRDVILEINDRIEKLNTAIRDGTWAEEMRQEEYLQDEPDNDEIEHRLEQEIQSVKDYHAVGWAVLKLVKKLDTLAYGKFMVMLDVD